MEGNGQENTIRWDTPRRLTIEIRPEWAGMRVSSVLRYKVGLSGTVLRRIKWVEDGILVDGVRAFADQKLCPGQTLDILLSDPSPSQEFPATPGELDIVYEDRDIIVVNKAPGVSVHPGPGHYGDTLGNFLLWHYRQQGEQAALHPVHRLDKGTSGLMVTAKHPFAQDQLRLQLHGGGFVRRYLAVCRGALEPLSGTIAGPIGRCEDSIMKRQVRPDGDRAVTHYETISVMGEFSLLRLQLDTGRTHQIRVHLSHMGHPLVGDFLYGQEEPELIPRPALHSAELELTHPVTGQRLSWQAPLPEDMERLIH
jgi:23S rRNA pseudouridine1911/1915/1917 synthase